LSFIRARITTASSSPSIAMWCSLRGPQRRGSDLQRQGSAAAGPGGRLPAPPRSLHRNVIKTWLNDPKPFSSTRPAACRTPPGRPGDTDLGRQRFGDHPDRHPDASAPAPHLPVARPALQGQEHRRRRVRRLHVMDGFPTRSPYRATKMTTRSANTTWCT